MPEPEPTPRKTSATPLRLPCPRCQGQLERVEEVGIANPRSLIRCTSCQTGWDDYKEVVAEGRARKHRERGAPLDLKKAQEALRKTKVGIRAGRNVVSGIRSIGQIVQRMAGEVLSLQEKDAEGVQDAIERIGGDFEGIVDQVLLATEHVDEARKGNLTPEPPLNEGDEDAERSEPE